MKIPLLTFSLLLASCAGDEPAPPEDRNETANGSEAAAEGPEGTSQPEALAPLTATGWGPLQVGMSLRQVSDALGPDDDPEAVGGPDPESCDQFHPERAPPGMLVMVEEGVLTSISLIDDSEVRTDRGLGLGDPAAAVGRTYSASASVTPHKYEAAPAAYMIWWAKGGAGKAFVEDMAARGISYEINAAGKIGAIHAGGPSIQYVEGCA